MENQLSFWAINIYSIIRTILDTSWYHLYKGEIKKDHRYNSGLSIINHTSSEIIQKAKHQAILAQKELSFASIFSQGHQKIIYNSIPKFRNFCFETLLSQYLC